MSFSTSSGSLCVWSFGCLLGLCPIVGCSQGAPSSAKGQVTLGGKAVEDGNLVLRPMKDTPGPPVATRIVGGKYEFALDKGLMAGTYLVLITAMDKGSQCIPDKYNVGSKLTVDLSPGANDKDFALEPGEVTVPPVMKGEESPPVPAK